MHQQNIVTSFGKNAPEAVRQLSIAITHWIIAKGLPFSLAEDVLFQRVLLFAMSVNPSYTPPGRNEVGGKYLDACYDEYHEKEYSTLLSKAKQQGLAAFGDGCTIDKTPLINFLAASPSNPSCLLECVDCTDHCSKGGKKDAEYILKQMLPLMKEIDPDRKYFDYVTFDGAANMQKAATFISYHFPMITVGPAIEHTVSLVFKAWMKLRPINELCSICSKVSFCFVFCKVINSLTFLSLLYQTGEECFWSTAPRTPLPIRPCSRVSQQNKERTKSIHQAVGMQNGWGGSSAFAGSWVSLSFN